jgi:hypothetical protein
MQARWGGPLIPSTRAADEMVDRQHDWHFDKYTDDR